MPHYNGIRTIPRYAHHDGLSGGQNLAIIGIGGIFTIFIQCNKDLYISEDSTKNLINCENFSLLAHVVL